MREFDLLEYQDKARNAASARELFFLWDRVSTFYERGHISAYELDEMKTVIWPRTRAFTRLKGQMDRVGKRKSG